MQEMKEQFTKNQHYIPRMYLRNFCVEGEKDKVFEYNKFSQKINLKYIETLCSKRYLYEVVTDDNKYIINKNAIEKTFSKIENLYSAFFKELFIKLDNNKNEKYIDMSNDDIEIIVSFYHFMFFRNYAILNEFGTEYNNFFNKELTKTEEKKYAWAAFFTRLFNDGIDFNDTLIEFLTTTKSKPFITSSFPFYFENNESPKYMPLSSKYAIRIRINDCVLRNLNRCQIIDVSDDIDNYNYIIASSKATSFIACDKLWLKKYIV